MTKKERDNKKCVETMQYYISENNLLICMFSAADNEKDKQDILHDISINMSRLYELTRDIY